VGSPLFRMGSHACFLCVCVRILAHSPYGFYTSSFREGSSEKYLHSSWLELVPFFRIYLRRIYMPYFTMCIGVIWQFSTNTYEEIIQVICAHMRSWLTHAIFTSKFFLTAVFQPLRHPLLCSSRTHGVPKWEGICPAVSHTV